ncbi:RCC1 domain-containing protein [Pseudomonas koreensis]|uniref:RCC1 domain-containing protein n=1 Tax=Pseudomonas koreensis TaxID=198620 RepID=UPI00320B9FF7
MKTKSTSEATNSDPDINALRPMIISKLATPVEGYDGGLGVVGVEGGVHFLVNAWLLMKEGDKVAVHWGDETVPVWSKTIELEDENQIVKGVIDEGHIRRGDAYPVFYSVTRANQEPEESPLQRVLVKLDRPGGFDDDFSTPGNQNLRYSIPQSIIDNGVGPEEAAAGVPITILPYPFMRINDRVKVAWGSAEKTVKVEQRHIDDPDDNPLVVTIDQPLIEEAGDSAGVIVVYQVIDECGNYPDPRSPWSAETRILVDLKESRLDAPIVLAADPETYEIDLDKLNDDDVKVLVNTPAGTFQEQDVVALTWRGINAEGVPINHGPVELPVTRVGVALVFTVPNDKVRAIAKGRASVSYILKRTGAADRPSKTVGISVTGETFRLPSPTVDEAPAGTLDPDERWATVRIPWFAGRAASDLLTLIWEATRPGGGIVYYEDPRPVGDVPDDEPVLRNVSNAEIQRFDGLQVSVFYTVANDDEATLNVRESLPFEMQVGEVQPLFVTPRVEEAVPGMSLIDPEAVPPLGCKLIVPYLQTLPEDLVNYRWRGTGGNGSTSGSLRLTAQTAGREVPFTVPKQFVTNNLNRRIVIDYFIVRDGKTLGYSFPLTLRVGNALLDFDPPSIDGARGDQIDASAVPAVGATVRLAAAYGLRVGDSGEIRWIGVAGGGTATVPFRVESGEAGRDKLISVLQSVVLANVGREISLDCTVVRQAGGRQYSRVAVYDVRASLGTGRLLVMGARSRGNYQMYGGGTAWLTALDATTRQPVKAWWRYNGEEGEVSGTTFRDTRPDRLLHVRISDDQVTINPQNLCGNGNFISGEGANNAAFAARTERGALVAWGSPGRGGNLGDLLPAISDAISLSACGYAFAARQASGAVVAWGLSGNGGEVSEPISPLRDIVAVSGNGYAFVALRRDGSLAAWGNLGLGATLPEPIAELRDVVKVIGNLYSFVALRANGSVVAWGHQTHGGNVPAIIAALTDVVDVVATSYAFAAVRANGAVVAWGYSFYGGSIPGQIGALTDIVELSGTEVAFAARRRNGSVVAWGYGRHGANVPAPIAALTDIRTVTGNIASFVALLSSGRVVGWGLQAIPAPVAALTDIVQVVCGGVAFAALRANGTVVAWGTADRGGEIPDAIVARLVNVRAIYGNTHAFAALTSSGEVVTWGRGPAGGNSDAVADQLNGKIFYEATALSRGLGMRETRLLEAAESEQTS